MESDSATGQARRDDIERCSVGLDLLLSADMCSQWPSLRARRRALFARLETLERALVGNAGCRVSSACSNLDSPHGPPP
eukprot:1968610-Alexandrium_andersonii.AAC.1